MKQSKYTKCSNMVESELELNKTEEYFKTLGPQNVI